MIKNFDTVKEYVYTLGGFEQTDKLNLQIRAIIDECLAYCYRSDVPELMELPLAEVIVDKIQKKSLIGVEGDVQSYSEGDMSVSFKSTENTIGKSFYNGKLEPFKLIVGA